MDIVNEHWNYILYCTKIYFEWPLIYSSEAPLYIRVLRLVTIVVCFPVANYLVITVILFHWTNGRPWNDRRDLQDARGLRHLCNITSGLLQIMATYGMAILSREKSLVLIELPFYELISCLKWYRRHINISSNNEHPGILDYVSIINYIGANILKWW